MNAKWCRIGILTFLLLSASFLIVVLFYIRTIHPAYIWVMDTGRLLNETYLVKMCPNGVRVAQVQFGQSGSIGVNVQTGSIWAPELNDREGIHFDQIVNIDADGKVIGRYQGYRTSTLAVDPRDGNVWISLPNEQEIVKLDAYGVPILRVAAFEDTASLAVDASDGSIWVAYFSSRKIIHLAADGTTLFAVETPGFFSDAPHQVAVDSRSSDVWYTGGVSGKIFKRSATGQLLATISGFDTPAAIAINSQNGDVWVADSSTTTSGAVVKLTSDGKIVARILLDKPPRSLAINSINQTIWVGIDGAMIELRENGEIIRKVQGFTIPQSIVFADDADTLLFQLRYVRKCLRYL